MSKALKCPNCNRIIHLKCGLSYDDIEVNIVGIIYVIICNKCKSTLVTELRKGENLEVNNEDE